LPFFHAAIAPRAHTGVLKAGWKAFVMRRFELEPFFAYSEKYQVTESGGVPPMIIAMIMSPLRNKYSLKSAKAAMAGGAPLGAGPQKRFEDLLGGAPFTQVYGMTEATCIAMMIPWPERDYTGGAGKPVANVDVKLVNDEGQDITAYDITGEICFRGLIVIPGYFENPEANKASFDADGFFHTGDVGYCDSKTKLWYIVDRKKELIKVRGFQVAPPELEAVLLSHPDIVDAGVIGVPASDYEGEAPRAYVVRRPRSDPSKLTEEAVKNYTGEKLSKYKRLEGGVKFVDAIPKNASGKILKRVLREQAKKELGLPSKL
jgi:4-coumarate--CoA ligase